jgi:hypothetical protein
LEESITPAKALWNDTAATQTQVEEATSSLISAAETARLILPVIADDKSKLEEALVEAEGVGHMLLTDILIGGNFALQGPFDELIGAIDAAEAVIDNPAATQAEVDAATIELLAAIAAAGAALYGNSSNGLFSPFTGVNEALAPPYEPDKKSGTKEESLETESPETESSETE